MAHADFQFRKVECILHFGRKDYVRFAMSITWLILMSNEEIWWLIPVPDASTARRRRRRRQGIATWPSFTEPAVAEAVELRPDNSLFMRRTRSLPNMRRTPGSVFDEARAHRRALLHQLGRALLRARAESGAPSSPPPRDRRRRRARLARTQPARSMIMFDQSRRLSEPLRWGRREKTVVAVLLSCVVLAAIGLGASR